jgi:hypothetical protein
MCIVAPNNVLGQGTQSQRRLSGQANVSPLDQYRMLMQLQRATQQTNAEELRRKLGLSEEQLKKLSEVFQKSGGLYQSDLPSQIKQLALEHPEIIEQAVETQKQLQRLQQNLPDAAPPEKSVPPKSTSTNQPSRVPDETEAPTRPDNRRSGNSPFRQDANQTPTSPTRQQMPPDSAASTQRAGRLLPDSFDNLLEKRPGATSGLEPSVARARSRDNAGAAADPPENTRDSGLPSNLSQELARRGWKNTLKHLVQTAQKEAARTNASGTSTENADSSTSLWSRTMASAVDRVRNNVVDVYNTQQRQEQGQRGKGSPTNDSRFRPPSRRDRESGLPQPAAPSEATHSPAEPIPPPLSFDDVLPKLPDDVSAESVFPFLLGVGLLIACLLFATRQHSHKQLSQVKLKNFPVKPKDIRSREDVIRAYHWLTEAITPDFAEWWHHRRAQETMVEYSPERSDAIREFAELYEMARYESSEKSFDEDRIQEARDALAGCLA